MGYIGSTPTTQSFIAGTDYFNGNGSTTAFTLSRNVVSVNDIQATVNNVVQQPNDAYNVSGNTITFTSAPSAGTGNVYVRYISTTTQSITPSQGTVGWAQLNSDTQQDLGISFKNRIINGAMVIDQRNAGAAVTNVTGAYILDRWNCGGSTDGAVTVQQSTTAPVGFVNSMRLTVATADASIGAAQYYQFYQPIEGYNVADLNFGTANAKTITISFWVNSSKTGTYCVTLTNAASNRLCPLNFSVNTANTWEYKTITVAGDTTGTWVTGNTTGIYLIVNLALGSNFNAGTSGTWNTTQYGTSSQVNWLDTVGANFYITGVQLEVGTQATTFDYRSYGTELQLCQRYYYRVTNTASSYAPLTQYGIAYNSSNCYCPVIFPQQLRATPTLSGSNIRLSNPADGFVSLSSITLQDASNVGCNVQTNGSGLTVYRNYNIVPTTTAGFIDFSAEL
jgi:hypothetical protein